MLSTRQRGVAWPDVFLAAGFLIPIVFFASVAVMAAQIEGYSHLSQTVSEIGRSGSPMEGPWRLSDLGVGILFLLFATGLAARSVALSLSLWPAALVGSFGLASVGISVFESPHPLHNVFGLAMTPGYLAPLVLAWTWRRDARVSRIGRWSSFVGVLVVVSVVLNLSPAFARDLYPLEYYGLVQRSLFVLFHGIWVTGIAWTMLRSNPRV